jgi:putative nucleotidyltransferase with HDIG domain
MGLSDGEIVTVRYGALLHDIGKLQVPLAYLHKPARLEPHEAEVVNMHPRNGMEMARLRNLPEPICHAILFHHERPDGNGYPFGLKGKDIPPAARIISVVDTWDTIVHKRCYRPAQAVEVAREEIRRYAGTQFDPEVAEKFLEMVAEIEEFERDRSGGVGRSDDDRQAAA